MKMTARFGLFLWGAAAWIALSAGLADAHTIKINFRCEPGGDVTFFAGNYHSNTTNAGGIIVDGGAPQAFTSVLTTLPVDATGGMSASCPSSPGIVGWQAVTVSGLSAGNHTVTTTSTSAIEAPWPGCFPQTFEISCVADNDGDGVTDDVDNCPDVANPDQADADGDGIGDVCEPDSDGDGVINDDDNCVSTPNPDQQDTDGDGEGNACDADDDGDGVNDGADNCPLIENADQADFDNDGQGDACDADVDGDGVNDAADICLGTAPGDVTDADGCSIAQICPCENPSGWKNHGAYVSCVAHASEDFLDLGLITEAEKDAIVSAAGESQCGHKK